VSRHAREEGLGRLQVVGTCPSEQGSQRAGVFRAHQAPRFVAMTAPDELRDMPAFQPPAASFLHGRGMLCRDEDEAEEAGPEYEGHLVAHIKAGGGRKHTGPLDCAGMGVKAGRGSGVVCMIARARLPPPLTADLGHVPPAVQVPPTYFEAQQQSPAGSTPRSLSRTPSDADAPASGGPAGGGSHPSAPGQAAAVSPAEIASMLLPGAGDAMAAAAAAAASGSTAQAPSLQPPDGVAVDVDAAPPAPTSPPPAGAREGSQQGPLSPQSPPPLSRQEHDVISTASDNLVAALATPHGTPAFRCVAAHSCLTRRSECCRSGCCPAMLHTHAPQPPASAAVRCDHSAARTACMAGGSSAHPSSPPLTPPHLSVYPPTPPSPVHQTPHPTFTCATQPRRSASPVPPAPSPTPSSQASLPLQLDGLQRLPHHPLPARGGGGAVRRAEAALPPVLHAG
jgi:hypothetical protein